MLPVPGAGMAVAVAGLLVPSSQSIRTGFFCQGLKGRGHQGKADFVIIPRDGEFAFRVGGFEIRGHAQPKDP